VQLTELMLYYASVALAVKTRDCSTAYTVLSLYMAASTIQSEYGDG